MMESVNNKILVSCDNGQKDFFKIGGSIFRSANIYETNYRLKSPVIAKVVESNEILNENDILLCHHNLFYLPSPYHLYDNLFSVPFSKVLFAKIFEDGELFPICGNILGERIEIPQKFHNVSCETYTDRIKVTNAGTTKYKEGQILFTRPSAPYDVSYIINGEQKIATKISEDMVCGIMK